MAIPVYNLYFCARKSPEQSGDLGLKGGDDAVDFLAFVVGCGVNSQIETEEIGVTFEIGEIFSRD